MTRRIPNSDALLLTELVPATTAGRPMIDDFIDRPRRQQRTALALMPGLSALLAPRRILPAPRRPVRCISARRLRRVTRRALGRALELRDPLVLTRDLRRQPLDLRLKARVLRGQCQQHLYDGITALRIDRFGLRPLHTTRFDEAALCPPDRLNAYQNTPFTRTSTVQFRFSGAIPGMLPRPDSLRRCWPPRGGRV